MLRCHCPAIFKVVNSLENVNYIPYFKIPIFACYSSVCEVIGWKRVGVLNVHSDMLRFKKKQLCNRRLNSYSLQCRLYASAVLHNLAHGSIFHKMSCVDWTVGT